MTETTTKAGETRGGWVVTAVLPGLARHVEIDCAAGTRRVVEARGEIVLAERLDGTMAGEFEAEEWAELGE